jgi:beta-xylosidase
MNLSINKAIDILKNWLESEEQYADSEEELQEMKEVQEALRTLEDIQIMKQKDVIKLKLKLNKDAL